MPMVIAVAGYWPAFGQAGKAQVTVGQLMSHQAGLPGFDTSVEPSIWFDRQAVLDYLRASASTAGTAASAGGRVA